MTAALDRLTAFQKALEAVTEFKDSLPLVTILILAHTDKKGIDLFGSIAQFANCDVLYMLNRQGHALEVTLSCMGARDIEEPADLTITLEKVPIETANGPEENLAVASGTVAAVKKSSKKDDDLTAMETVLNRIALGTIIGEQPWREMLAADKGKVIDLPPILRARALTRDRRAITARCWAITRGRAAVGPCTPPPATSPWR
jgi:hypothetical protein